MRGRGDPHDDAPARRPRRAPPPRVPTLGELAKETRWVWVYCASRDCFHRSAMALAKPIAQWGADASSDALRRNARYQHCGHRGARLQHPSWVNSAGGWELYPGDLPAS